MQLATAGSLHPCRPDLMVLSASPTYKRAGRSFLVSLSQPFLSPIFNHKPKSAQAMAHASARPPRPFTACRTGDLHAAALLCPWDISSPPPPPFTIFPTEHKGARWEPKPTVPLPVASAADAALVVRPAQSLFPQILGVTPHLPTPPAFPLTQFLCVFAGTPCTVFFTGSGARDRRSRRPSPLELLRLDSSQVEHQGTSLPLSPPPVSAPFLRSAAAAEDSLRRRYLVSPGRLRSPWLPPTTPPYGRPPCDLAAPPPSTSMCASTAHGITSTPQVHFDHLQSSPLIPSPATSRALSCHELPCGLPFIHFCVLSFTEK